MSVGEPVHPLPDLGEVVVHVRRPVVPRLLQQRQPAVGALLITGPGLTLSSSNTALLRKLKFAEILQSRRPSCGTSFVALLRTLHLVYSLLQVSHAHVKLQPVLGEAAMRCFISLFASDCVEERTW